jgi:hypothetical protein
MLCPAVLAPLCMHACTTRQECPGPGPWLVLTRSCSRLLQIYVDLAGWHLYTRDMSATPGMKMNQALATQLGPKVRLAVHERRGSRGRQHCGTWCQP